MKFLFVAYTAIWTLIFIYTLYMGHIQSKLVKELELVKNALNDKK